MEIDSIKRAEFYKNIHEQELSRGENLNSMVQFPTTLIVVFFSAFIYLVKEFSLTLELDRISDFQWSFIIAGLVCISALILSVLSLGAAFHGQSRRYLHLPFTSELRMREDELYKHYYAYHLETNAKNKRKKTLEKVSKQYIKELTEIYVKNADHNMKLNHKRSAHLFKTRISLLIGLIAIMLMSLFIIQIQIT